VLETDSSSAAEAEFVPEDTDEVNTDPDTFNAEEEFKRVYDRAVKLGLTGEDFAKMDVLKDIRWSGSYFRVTMKYTLYAFLVVLILTNSFLMSYLVGWPVSRDRALHFWFWAHGEEPSEEQCTIYMPEFVNGIFRPPVDCDFCENVTEVETVFNISAEEFEELYGYSGVPVVVGDGTVNWTATDYFSFDFFKEIYKEGSAALDNQMKNCQFFPYKTSFHDLSEVLGMSPERASMEDGSQPWYIGW